MSGHTNWRDIKHKKDAPKQTTPAGMEIPVPERKTVMDAFKRIAMPKPKRKP